MQKKEKFRRRKKAVRSKIVGTKACPRLSVYRSNKYIYAQLIDDQQGSTLVLVGEKNLGTKKATKKEKARLVGEMLAKKAKAKKISKVVFDRSGYKYHGRVQALADGARKGGLKF